MLGMQQETAQASGGDGAVVRNLNGQKLGRKGKDTRQRILAAAAALICGPATEPVSMSAVARRADLGMTSLYLYFADLTELLLALLEPVMAEGREELTALIEPRWDDDRLAGHCFVYMRAFLGFWSRHSALLHLRNTMADSGDERMMLARVNSSLPMIHHLAAQMDGVRAETDSPAYALATVLATGIERMVTMATDRRMTALFGAEVSRDADHYLAVEARLLELAIRDMRVPR